LTCPKGDELTVEVVRASSKITGKVAGGKPKIEVHIFAEENVGEVQCELDLTKSETIEQLEAIAEKKLKKIITASIRKAQKHKADIFGFGEAIEDADPKAWLGMKKDWGSRFAELDVSVHTDVEIRRLGTTNNSLLEKRK
jgi:spore germination protein KC